MLVFLVAALAAVVVFVAIAALSDHRDRRSGIDPKVRTEDVTKLRRDLKEQLHKSRSKRLGYVDPDEDPRQADPWR